MAAFLHSWRPRKDRITLKYDILECSYNSAARHSAATYIATRVSPVNVSSQSTVLSKYTCHSPIVMIVHAQDALRLYSLLASRAIDFQARLLPPQ